MLYHVTEPPYKELLKRARRRVYGIEDLDEWEEEVRKEAWLFESVPSYRRLLRFVCPPPPGLPPTGR